MGPTWVLLAPGGPHVGLMNPAIWVCILPLEDFYYPRDAILLSYSLKNMSSPAEQVLTKRDLRLGPAEV